MQPNKPTDISRAMRKYYIGSAILGGVILAVAALLANSAGRHDRIARQELERTAREVASRYDNTQKLPKTLQELYPKNPPKTVTYTSFSNGVFMVCADFESQKPGSSASYGSSNDQANAEAIKNLQQFKDPSAHYKVLPRYDYYSLGNEKGKNCYITQVSQSNELPSTPLIKQENI